MKFSIITPCYNCVEFIEQCILSIKNQNYHDFEHIIVDGGSTDGTLEIIQKYENTYSMRWVSGKDNGMYDAINKGFAMAKGDIYSWINADDFYMPWALSTVSKAMEEYPNVKWITGIPSNMDANGNLYFRSGFSVNTYNQKCIAKGQHHGRGKGTIQQESTFWRKELWEQVAGLDSKYKYAGDFDLWRRFAQFAPLYTVNTVLASFRTHDNQKSSNYVAYCNEIEEYCTWGNFFWWVANKIFHIKRVYNKRNSKMLINCIVTEDRSGNYHDVLQYVRRLFLRK